MRLRRLAAGVLLLASAACASTPESLHDGARRDLERGDPASAAATLERALELPGLTPSERVPMLHDLGDLYLTYPDLGKEEQAQAVLEEGLATPGLPEPWRIALLERLGSHLAIQGRWAEARGPLEEVLRAHVRRAGAERAYGSQAAFDLRRVYHEIGASAEAEELSRLIARPHEHTPDPATRSGALAAERAPVAAFDELFLGGAAGPAYTEADMPLRVAIGLPKTPARDATPEETRLAAVSGLREWEFALRRLLPWFELEFVEREPSAPIQVEWSRRPRAFLPAHGEISLDDDGGTVSSRIVLSAQPLLGGEFMESFVIEIDFPARVVRFLDPDVHAVGDDPEELVIPLKMRERRPYAELELGSGSVLALVDTGAQAPLSITEEKARELGIELDRSAERIRYTNVVGTSTDFVHSVPKARIGALELVDASLLIAARDESSARIQRYLKDETIIGIDILKGYRARFDYPRGRLGLSRGPR